MNERNTNNSNPYGIDANSDPITGAPGAHPVGTGLGAIGAGAAAGAAGGALGGPVGAVAGAAVGAVVGGLAGKAAAEAVNPTIETKFWKESHSARPYGHNGFVYEEYAPAYRYGWESFGRREHEGETFDNVEADLGRGWDHVKGSSRLVWDQAKLATRDAWDRVESAARGARAPAAH
jgi:hypothetical protein